MTMDYLFHFAELDPEEVTIEEFTSEKIPAGFRMLVGETLVYKDLEPITNQIFYFYFDELGGVKLYNFD